MLAALLSSHAAEGFPAGPLVPETSKNLLRLSLIFSHCGQLLIPAYKIQEKAWAFPFTDLVPFFLLIFKTIISILSISTIL